MQDGSIGSSRPVVGQIRGIRVKAAELLEVLRGRLLPSVAVWGAVSSWPKKRLDPARSPRFPLILLVNPAVLAGGPPGRVYAACRRFSQAGRARLQTATAGL